MFNKKNMSVFDKIDKHLTKLKHESVMSLYLDGYNNNDIYIRFDYVRDIMAYKIVWVDLKFFDEKNMDKYINMQLVTNILAERLVKLLIEIDYPSDAIINEKIIGDRVEFVNYQNVEVKEYIFDRFLPLEWKKLIDPIVIVFSYLPRSMDVFLNEIFAKFDGVEEKYMVMKPIKYNIMNEEDDTSIFKPNVISAGRKEYLDERVTFLDKLEDKYVAIVEGNIDSLVVIREIDKDHVLLWCSCKLESFCKHIYAVILAIRNEKFKEFYKVTYTGRKDETLLQKLSYGSFNMCYGVDGDDLLIVGNDLQLMKVPILDHNGKCVFKVIEDDDNLSLSKIIDSYKK